MSLSPTARHREFPRYVFVAKLPVWFARPRAFSTLDFWLFIVGTKPLPWELKFRGNKNSIPNAHRGNKHEPWELGVEMRSHEAQETGRKNFKAPDKNQSSGWFQRNIESRLLSWRFPTLWVPVWWFQRNIESTSPHHASWTRWWH